MNTFAKPLAIWALGIFLVAASGSFAQTVATTKKRIPQDGTTVALINLLTAAQDAAAHQDYDTAAAKYQEFLEKKPDDATVHYNLGYVYSAMRRPADAKGEYEKAISLDPKMAPAYQNLGLTLIPSDPAAAVGPLQHAAELEPGNARTKWLLGTALEATGKVAPAIEQYEAAEKLDDKDADIRNSLGFALLRAGRTSDAETTLRQALALRPGGSAAAEAHKGLARALIAEKKLDAAAAELGAYLAAQPNDAAARVDRASLLVDLTQYDEALAELDRAAAARPEDIRALKLRALIFYRKKRYDDAVPVLQKAIAVAPQDPNLPAQLGHIYLEKKDYPNALKELVVAFKMDTTSTDALGDLVTAQYLNKNYPAALQGLDMLSQRKTLPAGSWFVRATCYDKLGQPAQALDAYKKFLELNTDQNNDMYFEASARVRTLKRELEKKR
jgi:tetratricopeptide (TPR) repeat protein